LRFWEKEFDGILVPIRTTGRQRRYTVQNTFIIEEIKQLRKNEMSLTEIKGKLSISGKA
jgi:DNA-binding transcriptional MerR regulator